MHTVNKYKNILISEFYLDSYDQVRRSNDGYQNRFMAGDLANFFTGSNGYLRIQVPTKRTTLIKSHLVLLLKGINIPDTHEVDHIDGNRHNDLPSNLRVVNRRTNSCNRKMRSDNNSGYTGIRWSDYHNHYIIRKTIKGKRICTSRKTLDEAKIALDNLSKLDNDYTLRHGK